MRVRSCYVRGMIYTADVSIYHPDYTRESERVQRWHEVYTACVGILVATLGHEDGIMAAQAVADDTHGALVVSTPEVDTNPDAPTS